MTVSFRLVMGVVIGVFVIATDAVGDDRVQWLRDHTIEIKTAAPITDDDFDLSRLVDVIGDARVVQLGEATHGDGTAFLLRTRIVQFLHNHLDFNALAFESGFYECRAVQSAIPDETVDLQEVIRLGVYPIWAESEQMQPLFKFLRKSNATERPVEFIGYDVQFSRRSTEKLLSTELANVLVTLDGKKIDNEQRERLDAITQAVGGAGQYKIDAETHELNQQLLQRFRSMTPSEDATVPPGEWNQVINGLVRMEQAVRFGSQAPPFDPRDPDKTFNSPFRISAANARDRGMAENALWWLDGPGRDRKLIVWAANRHVEYGSPRRGDDPTIEAPIPAGAHLHRELGDDVYTILTIPYAGLWAAPSIQTAAGELQWTSGEHVKAVEESLASLLHEIGYDLSFLDLRQIRNDPDHWLNQPMVLRQNIYSGKPVVLSKYCDGILFIDSMNPSAPLKQD